MITWTHLFILTAIAVALAWVVFIFAYPTVQRLRGAPIDGDYIAMPLLWILAILGIGASATLSAVASSDLGEQEGGSVGFELEDQYLLLSDAAPTGNNAHLIGAWENLQDD